MGDQVIKEVVKTISNLIQEDAIFARLGGEEFSVVCSVSSLDEMRENMELIRKAVSDLKIISDENEVIQCTISAGFAKAKSETKSLEALLKEADIALYEAKGLGRNRSIFRE